MKINICGGKSRVAKQGGKNRTARAGRQEQSPCPTDGLISWVGVNLNRQDRHLRFYTNLS